MASDTGTQHETATDKAATDETTDRAAVTVSEATTRVIGYAARHAISALRPMAIERRLPGEHEVAIEILYCGVCHSDVHQVRNEWHNTVYPCMPGHEIIGRVTAAGRRVTRHAVGDLVGVGCMIDSCQHCASCAGGEEQYCEHGFLATYNGNSRNPTEANNTFGGYSESIVVREDFVLRIPDNLDPAAAAPILCAGVTTFSPLRHWKVGRGTRVGVVGLGGLGHMAVKLATAMGATVSLITRSPDKADDARRIGATGVIVSTDTADMEAHAGQFDFILSTIPQPHDPNPYMALLARDGVYTVVGCIAPLTKPLDLSKILIERKSLGTSLIGSITETQAVLDFCSLHDIVSDIEIIGIDSINEAFDRVDKGEVDYRFVIDMASLRGQAPDESLAAKIGL